MLELGINTCVIGQTVQQLVKLSIFSVIVLADDDENVIVKLFISDAATRAALLNGITQGTGNKVNGTCTLTVENDTDPSDVKTAVDTFNIFQYDSTTLTAEKDYFLSLATSNITISSGDDYKAVDLTAGTFVGDSLDASGSGNTYDFNCIISIPGFETSDITSRNNISIDAA
jgi:hypothetical protein